MYISPNLTLMLICLMLTVSEKGVVKKKKLYWHNSELNRERLSLRKTILFLKSWGKRNKLVVEI